MLSLINDSDTSHNFLTGCKESQFYSLPFGQTEASIYKAKCHFNYPQKPFDEQN